MRSHTASDQTSILGDLVTPLILVAMAAAFRLVPHPPNFTPIGALALFAGASFSSRRWAVAAPLAAMLVSDFWLGFHPYMPVVYGCMLVNVSLGCWVRSVSVRSASVRRVSVRSASARRAQYGALVAGGSLIGAIVFFLATNFAVWLAVYEPTWSGLAACYTAAIPFFRYTLAGDMVFTAGLFSAYALSCLWRTAPKPADAY